MPQQLSLDLQLDIMPTTQDKDNLYDIAKLYNAVKLVASALDSYTGILGAEPEDYASADTRFITIQNMARLYRKAAVAISGGNTVSLNSSGEYILGTIGTVVGWAPSAIAAGSYGEVKLLGLCPNIGGLTPGAAYYASATAGLVTATVTAQKIGIALASTRMMFNPS